MVTFHNKKKFLLYFPHVDPHTMERVLSDSFHHLSLNIDVTFVNLQLIEEMNDLHRGKKEATDVLSFRPLTSSDPSEVELTEKADILISLEYIKDSLEHFTEDRFLEEVIRCIIHGILHISGYDHEGYFTEKNKQLEPMYLEQERVLKVVLGEIKGSIAG